MTSAQLLAFRGQVQDTLEALWPTTISLPGIVDPIACAGGNLRTVAMDLELGGFVNDYDLFFRVRKSLVPTMPSVGIRLTWQSAEYRIMRVGGDSADSAWFIGADNPNK
jgi:hypothetical protein